MLLITFLKRIYLKKQQTTLMLTYNKEEIHIKQKATAILTARITITFTYWKLALTDYRILLVKQLLYLTEDQYMTTGGTLVSYTEEN